MKLKRHLHSAPSTSQLNLIICITIVIHCAICFISIIIVASAAAKSSGGDVVVVVAADVAQMNYENLR